MEKIVTAREPNEGSVGTRRLSNDTRTIEFALNFKVLTEIEFRAASRPGASGGPPFLFYGAPQSSGDNGQFRCVPRVTSRRFRVRARRVLESLGLQVARYESGLGTPSGS